jgi:O-antigen/teichoic acid export membrane protein
MGSRTLRNTALILTARVLSRLVALLSVVLVIKHLREAGFGGFQDVVNTTALVTVVLDLGFNTLFQREAARRPAEISRYLSNMVASKLLFAIPALAVLAGALLVTGKLKYLLPAFLMMTLASYSTMLRGPLYVVQRLGFEAAAIVLESLVLLGLVFYGVRTAQSVPYFLWAYVGSYAFSCAYFVVVLTVRRVARIRPRFEPALVRQWFWTGLPFALAFVITTIYFKIDVPILDFVRGDREVGLYGAAYKPFEALLFIPLSMFNVVFPILAVYHREASGRVAWAVAKFYKSLLMLGWPISIGLFLLARAFRFIYQFPESATSLQILALGVVFMFVSNAFIAALNAVDRQVMFTWAALGSMVVNVLLNVALIPPFGYLGASWATVLTEVALTAISYVMVARELGRVPVFGLSWRILLAGLAMGVVIYPFHQETGPRAVGVIMGGALIYAAALFLLGAVDRDEREMLRRALRR